MSAIALKMTGISKEFPGVMALQDVSLELRKGEIHALVGENGAGKSTLIKVLGGYHTPDRGTIEINGALVNIQNPSDAIHNKLGIIYQEFNLVQTLDVAENLFLGRELVKMAGHLRRKKMYELASEIMASLGIQDFDCHTKVKNLSVAMQQLVEIGKAIFNDISILVMDEPTAVLTERETKHLFDLMKGLKEKGISIIYISHRIEEVLAMCDRITVLRDGQYVTTLDNQTHEIRKDLIVNKMVGRELSAYYPSKKDVNMETPVLQVRNLTKKPLFEDISFCVHRGEILGFSGLVGAGRSEIMKSIFGDIRKNSGEIYLYDVLIEIHSPKDAHDVGIAYVPEDRKKEGIVRKMTLSDNICLASHERLSIAGHFISGKRRTLVEESIHNLSIKPAAAGQQIELFSGGNQQKAVIAKWLATEPKVIILDEPTRGIDVGAKVEIYTIINELAAQGLAVMLVSSELPELLGICDRIIVIREGKISGVFGKKEFNQDDIMSVAID